MSDYEARANLDAEECVIGIALSYPSTVAPLVAELTPADFYKPSHALIFGAIVDLHQSGHATDVITVADMLMRVGVLDRVGGTVALSALEANHTAASSASTHAAIIRREATARALDLALREGRSELEKFGDPVDIADSVAERIRNLDRGGQLPERYWRSVDDYLAASHQGVGSPLIEGVCYQHTRCLVLATEKLGKSMLQRQMAACIASGLHPFSFKPITPVRVLLLDAENDDDEILPTMDRLRELVGHSPVAHWDPTYLALFSAPYGLDLRSRRDRAELEEVLDDFRPQIIIGGPIYKLMEQADNVSDPRHAERLQRALDDIRKRWGCALILEHHAPAGRSGAEREIRSIGGQRWAAWPEVTVALHAKNGGESADVRYPHPPRGKFRWPKRFDRGTRVWEWPWMPVARNTEDGPPPIDAPESPEEPF